jgi:hypothetical protein
MKTLFAFDDHSIPFRSNLELVMLQGVKYSGNPVLKRGVPGSPDAKWARLWAGTVLHDQGKFRMWYSGTGSVEEWMGLRFNMLYAESDDGINWTKPDLGLVEYRGSRENNIVDIEHSIEMPAVVLDDGPDVPLDERYKMFSENLHNSPIKPFISVSRDGLHWSTVAHPKYRGVSLYRFKGLYHSAFVDHTRLLPGGYDGGRVMGVIRSRDYKNWAGGPCLGFHRGNYFTHPPDATEQVHTPAGFWNRDNVVLGVYGQIHQVDAVTGTRPVRLGSGLENVREDLGLFLSNDGLHFREPVPGFKIVGRGQEGRWDGGSVVPANAFVNVGEHTYLYYGGWDNGLCYENSVGDVGLAFWRRDGFGYLRIRDGKTPAVMQTEAIVSTGKDREIFVNFDIDSFSEGCGLDFELVDQSGHVLPGYFADECITCTESGFLRPVRWKNHDSISKDIKGPVEIRVVFQTNGETNESVQYPSSPMLYSMYIADKEEMK